MTSSRTLASPMVNPSLPAIFTDELPLPKLVVFDLDYTLWPFWVDTHVSPPLKPVDNGTKVKDRYRETLTFYYDVPEILATLKHCGIKIGAASRTDAEHLAREMLSLLRISETPSMLMASSASSSKTTSAASSVSSIPNPVESKRRKALEFFDHLQIYPGSKKTHFSHLHRDTGIPYEEMLFFDDEPRNRDVEKLGVIMWLVRNGITWDELENGIHTWRKKTGKLKSDSDDVKDEL